MTRDGFADPCDFDTMGETDWGCKHDGDAKFDRYYDDTYDPLSETESVRVCDGSDGNFEFTISHYFPSVDSSSKNHEQDYMYAGTLNLSINGKDYGDYQHEVDKDIKTHDVDGNVNSLYPGQKTITVDCDATCNCVVIPITESTVSPTTKPSVAPTPKPSASPTPEPTVSPETTCALNAVLYFPQDLDGKWAGYYYGYHND